ncbi:MAG: phage tail protein [Caldilineales bacterium]|nr:phage tail protein [Caldilineales bacterium]MDW8318325.1 phage tail protein [Anaerolineae bacterium]
MATERTNPYGTFNFLVDLGTGDTGSIRAGFQEVSGLNVEVTSAEYRNGNEPVNHVRKLNGIYKVGDVTLKRGLIGAMDLFEWIKQVREGDQAARRNITIHLRDESGANTVMTWRLTNARPLRYTAPSLNAKGGTDVAIEELVLSCEDMTIE